MWYRDSNNDSLALHRDATWWFNQSSMNGWGFNSSRMNPNVQVNLFKYNKMGQSGGLCNLLEINKLVFHANYHDY